MDEELKKQGIISKYNISKANGEPLDEGAKYFVLRYDKGGSDPIHLKASQIALSVYAYEIRDHLPVLSKELGELMTKYLNEVGR